MATKILAQTAQSDFLISILSADGHKFYISLNAAKLCQNLYDQIMTLHLKGGDEVSLKLEQPKKVVELFIDYLYYKLRYLGDDYDKMPQFEIPPKYVTGLYKLSSQYQL